MSTFKGFFTTKEAAEHLKVAQSYIYQLVNRGRLKAVHVGEWMLLIDEESLKAFTRNPRGRPRKNKTSTPRTKHGRSEK
ncbi:MAG TPA: helix-turn-helix domain-containing protein [Planctomycetota bacterium]|nr:helix-turn-helix domain-containing protein [Planctomycetota bacterium]